MYHRWHHYPTLRIKLNGGACRGGGIPDSIQVALLHLKDAASAEAADALRKLHESLAPLMDKLIPLTALPQKLGQILGKVETWYDTIMHSFATRYTNSMKTIALIISFLVVATLNANLFSLYREISSNDLKRNMIIQSSDQITAKLREQADANSQQINQTLQQWAKQSFDEIDKEGSLYTSLGISGPRWIVDAWRNPQRPTVEKVVETLAGWLITALLLSVGAPFWQDALASLFGLKNLLRKKDPTGKE